MGNCWAGDWKNYFNSGMIGGNMWNIQRYEK